MISYTSSLQNIPPVAPPPAAPALSAVARKSPYPSFSAHHQDVLRGLASTATPALNMQAYAANADYALEQQQARQALALSGLQQQAEAQQQDRNLGVQQLRNMTGVYSNLLSGLFS